MDAEQLQKDFRENGYVYIPGFLNTVEVEEVLHHLDALIRDKLPSMPQEHVFYEEKGNTATLKQIQLLYNYDPFFRQMMFGSKFEQLARLLLNDEAVGRNMQYFNKPPLIGKATPPHQDGYYFMLDPCEALTMWLGLEEVNEENGCVRYVRGSHKKGLRSHGNTQVLGFSQGITDYGTEDDRINEVYFSTGPGDLLVHHALTVHRADPNRSSGRSRKALGFIYYAAKAREDVDRKQTYQEALAKDLKADGKI